VLDHNQPIEEWFKLFLNIVEDEYMLKEMRKSLKVALSVDEGEEKDHLPTYQKIIPEE